MPELNITLAKRLALTAILMLIVAIVLLMQWKVRDLHFDAFQAEKS